MTSTWQQLLAAVLAALIPAVVKLLNDWHDSLTIPQSGTTEGVPSPPSPGPASPEGVPGPDSPSH